MDNSDHEERMEGAGDFWAWVGQGLGWKQKFEAEADRVEDNEFTAMLEEMLRHREEMAKKREEETQPGTLAEAMRKLEEDYIDRNGNN